MASNAQVAESAFSFLHMELVQLALGPQGSGQQTGSSRSGGATTATPATTAQLPHASRKIEAIGFQVGVRLVERYTKDRPRFGETIEIIKFICKEFLTEVYHKTMDKLQTNNRVGNRTVVVVLLVAHNARDFESHAQGVYMLQDFAHPILLRCSPSASRQATAKQIAALHIKFPSGLIRGALSGLGVVASVSAEVSELPRCQFTVKIQSGPH